MGAMGTDRIDTLEFVTNTPLSSVPFIESLPESRRMLRTPSPSMP